MRRSIRAKSLLFYLMLTLIFGLISTMQNPAQDFNVIPEVIAWSPDGSMIAVGGSERACDRDTPNPDRLRVFDATTMDVLFFVSDTGCSVVSLSWSPDSTRIAISDGNVGIRIWDTVSQEYDPNVFASSSAGVAYSVRWSPDDSQLAYGDISSKVGTIDVATGDISAQFASGFHVDWNPDGTQLAVTLFNFLTIYDMATRTPIETLEYHEGLIENVDWSVTGEIIATYSPVPFDLTLRIIDTDTLQNTVTISTEVYLTDMELSHDGSMVVGVGPLPGLSIWDTMTGELLMTIEQEGIYGVAWSPDGSQITYVGNFPDEIVTLDLEIEDADSDDSSN